jgi:hypothetical protein
VRAISAAATAGLGAAAVVGLRVLLPDVASLDAMGTATPKAAVELLFTFGAVALGAGLGLLAALAPSRWLVAGGSLALAVPAWLGIAASSVRNTLGSIKTGDALVASVLASPVWLVLAGGSLLIAFIGCLVAGFCLSLLARVLDRAGPLAWAIAIVAWPLAVATAARSASTVPPDAVEAIAAPAAPLPSPPPACGDVPFASAIADASLRGPSRSLPQEGVVEYRVLGPGSWTPSDLSQAVAGLESRGLECLSGASTVRLRVAPAQTVRVKLRLEAHRPAGQDREGFKMMLESQLRSAFDGAMQVTEQGTFATSLQAGWSMIPRGAVRGGFRCEVADAAVDVVCDGDHIEVRSFGVAPAFGGVVLNSAP